MLCNVGTTSTPLVCRLKNSSDTSRAPFKSTCRSSVGFPIKKRLPNQHCQESPVLTCGLRKDTVEGWIDLSKLVSGSGGIKTAYEDLAYKIGHDVYIDVSGWHLFLREVKAAKGLNLAQALAQQFGQDISSQNYKSSKLEEVLKKVPIKLGGGKTQLPLSDLLPSAGVQDLERILADFERDQ